MEKSIFYARIAVYKIFFFSELSFKYYKGLYFHSYNNVGMFIWKKKVNDIF